MTDRIETPNVNLGFIGEFKESVPRRLRQILTTGNSKVAVLAAILPCFFFWFYLVVAIICGCNHSATVSSGSPSSETLHSLLEF